MQVCNHQKPANCQTQEAALAYLEQPPNLTATPTGLELFDMDMTFAVSAHPVSLREVLSNACIRYPVQSVVVHT